MTAVEHDGASLRLDKWLWHARFFKTRSIAAKVARDGGVRVDGVSKTRASALVRCGQTLTFAAGERVRVVRILGLGTRRGPALEAQALYEDLSPPALDRKPSTAPRPRGAGRPTKAERRATDRLKGDM